MDTETFTSLLLYTKAQVSSQNLDCKGGFLLTGMLSDIILQNQR